MIDEKTTYDGEIAARYFKYYLQQKNQYVVYKMPFDKLQIKGLYGKHKAVFDKIAFIFSKYSLKLDKYIEYFVVKLNKYERDVDKLVDMHTFNLYMNELSIKNENRKIYSYYVKSVKNVANDCVSLGFLTVMDYFRHLIAERKLAAYVAAGKISQYYIAAIPKFKKIIPKLDLMSRNELMRIYDRFEQLNNDVNSAHLMFKSIKSTPIKTTNDLIFKLRSEKV